MSKKRIAVVGYGNIGRSAVQAMEACPDMDLAGVVRRDPGRDRPKELADVPVVADIAELGAVDAALLCTPTRAVVDTASQFLGAGINTVDCFDIHSSIVEVRRQLGAVAKAHDAVAVVAAGWDPGSDSVIRTLLQACAPKGLTHTDFGPGLSMGHSVAARAADGVADALSLTIPLGTGMHRRVVYVELAPGATLDAVTAAIKADPYFSHDETHVVAVESVDEIRDAGHGVNLTRKGVSGTTNNQLFEFKMHIDNPALTSQIMVSCARASFCLAPGAYTMPEIPVIDLLPGDREALLAHLV